MTISRSSRNHRNVGIVTTWFDRGAAFVSRQIMSVLQSEFDVYIYARGERYEKGNPEWDLPNVHWGKRVFWPGSGKIDREDFESWLDVNAIDVVIFNEQRWWQPIIWAKDKGVVTGAYIDYYTLDSIGNFVAYDFLICNTKRHLEAFRWHPGVHYIPWGTDTELFKPVKANKTDGPVVFFHSCGVQPYRKGTDLLIRAFNKVKSMIDARLVIHTQVPLALRDIDTSGIEIIERTVSPPGLFHLGDVYVYPSRLDGIGLTVCEALACGLPVITTNSPPMSEFVRDGYNGFLVDVAVVSRRKDGYYWPITEVSIEALAEKMVHVYNARGTLAQFKSKAREYAVAELDWRKNSVALKEIVRNPEYRKLVPAVREQIRTYDYRGLKGKVDRLYNIPLARNLVEKLTRVYRKYRQPHLYN